MSQLHLKDLIEDWCKSDLVSLPSSSLPASNGMITPLEDKQLKGFSHHLLSALATKSNFCRGCLEAEGPSRIRRLMRDVERARHTH